MNPNPAQKRYESWNKRMGSRLFKIVTSHSYLVCISFYLKNVLITCKIPSSSFDFVIKSAVSLTIGCAFSIATPSPAYSIMEMSLNPSPQQIMESAVSPILLSSFCREYALSIFWGMISRKNGSER